MQKLVQGIHQFQDSVFRPRRAWFERLADGQRPLALFITCSDSRIVPTLLTQTEPGELFIVRNAGNIVPPHQVTAGGEQATIEFAITALGVKDVIVCGHTRCGAMTGLLHPDRLGDMPAVEQWLAHAEATRRIIQEKYEHLDDEARGTAAAQENVLVQLENLRTHPAVLAGLSRGELRIHGWMYKLEAGAIFAYDPETGQFDPIDEQVSASIPAPRLAAAIL